MSSPLYANEGKPLSLELNIPRVSAVFAPPEGAPHPTIWLTVKFPGEDKPIRTAAFPFAGDHYATNFKMTFSRTGGKQLCNEVVSTPLVITVYKDAPPAPIQIKPDAKAKAKGEKPREVEAPLPSDFICRMTAPLSALLMGESSVQDDERPFSIVNDSQDEKARVRLEPSVAFSVSAFELPAAAEGEAAAPEPLPCTLMSREAFDRCTVLELRVNGFSSASPLPAELLAALEKGAGSLVVTLAMPIPVGPSEESVIVVTDGKLNAEKDGVAFSNPVGKTLLTDANVAYMTSNIDQGSLVPLEFARQLKRGADYTDPAAPRYHAVGQLDLGPLVKPGFEGEAFEVPLGLSLAAALAQGVAKASRIPEGPHTEGQPIEEVAPELIEQNALEPIGLVARVEVAVSRPLLPPWTAPEPPSTTLAELIPPPNAGSGSDAQASTIDSFREKCRKVAKDVAQEYLRVTGAGNPSADPSSHAERQREMRFFLNRSGKFAQVRELLREQVVAVIRSRMAVPSPGASTEELLPLYNDVYMCLVQEVHRALDEVFRPRPAVEEDVKGPGEDKARALASLAAECEAMGLWPRAQQLFLDSLLGSKAAPEWLSYAAFLCRKGDLGPAEQALREAVALDPGSLPALASLASLLIDLSVKEDALRLREAEVVAQAARLLMPESPLAWTLLALVYGGMGPLKATEAQNSIYEARRLSREVHGSDPSDGPLQAALMALDLQLPEAAEAALKLLPPAASLPAPVQCEAELASCRLLSLRGEVAAALEAAKRGAALLGDPEDLRVHLLKADCYHRAGKASETATQYQIAIQKAQMAGKLGAVPLQAYLRLGQALTELEDAQGALKAFLLGAQESPCASTWLGAGRTLVKLGDLDRADLALTEASTLDSQHPEVWGLMALVALRQERRAESEQALKYALKFGFSDAGVLREIGERYFSEGSFRTAEGVFKRALAAEEDSETRLKLAEALIEQGETREGKVEVLKALRDLEDAGNLTPELRVRGTVLLKRAAVDLGEQPPSEESSQVSVGGTTKKPHERVMVFLGSTSVH